MPGIVALVTAIGNDVNAKLVAAGYPSLIDGTIVLGQVHVEENAAAPRIILVPESSKFGPRSTGNRQAMSTTNPIPQGAGVRAYPISQYGGGYTTATATVGVPDIAGGVQATATCVLSNGSVVRVLPNVIGTGYLKPPTVTISGDGTGAACASVLDRTIEQLAQVQQRAIFTETVTFRAHVWGVTPAGTDPIADFDAAQVLYQQLIVSTWLLAPGIVRIGQGVWMDSKPGATQVDAFGRYFVCTVEIDTPVTDAPLVFAPPAVRANATLQITSPTTGTTETGFAGLE